MTPDTSITDEGKSKQEIFIQAYGDHEKALLRRSFFKVSNHELADDLVQTTFLKTWEYLVNVGEIDSMKAFLFHALNNLIIDEYRKKKPVSLEHLSEKGFTVSVDDSQELFDTIDGKTALLLVPLLSDKYRDVVSMRYIDDMALKEIAQVTKQSQATVAVQIHRGVGKLAVLFCADTGKQIPILKK